MTKTKITLWRKPWVRCASGAYAEVTAWSPSKEDFSSHYPSAFGEWESKEVELEDADGE